MGVLLECSGLTKRFGKREALKQVDLSVESGKIVGLLGPNGSGKTTLIKLANGLLRPDGGSIRIDGQEPGVYTKSIVSYLPDRMYFADWMRVSDMVRMFRDFYTDFRLETAVPREKSSQIPLLFYRKRSPSLHRRRLLPYTAFPPAPWSSPPSDAASSGPVSLNLSYYRAYRPENHRVSP